MNTDSWDDDIHSFRKALRENRLRTAGERLQELNERLEDAKEQRRQRKVNIEVKHVDAIEYDIDTHDTFIAYQFDDKTMYGTGNSLQSAVIDFAESYLGGDDDV